MDGDACKATPDCTGVIEDGYCTVCGRIGTRPVVDAVAGQAHEPSVDAGGPVSPGSNGRAGGVAGMTTATAADGTADETGTSSIPRSPQNEGLRSPQHERSPSPDAGGPLPPRGPPALPTLPESPARDRADPRRHRQGEPRPPCVAAVLEAALEPGSSACLRCPCWTPPRP